MTLPTTGSPAGDTLLGTLVVVLFAAGLLAWDVSRTCVRVIRRRE